MFFGEKTVLIVDDDPSIVQPLKAILERHGCQTCIAMDGKEAIEKLNEKKPDLIILDLLLPEMPGEMVCKTVKRNEKFKDIPVIMVTAKCTEVDRIIGRVVGADYYISKPFDAMALLRLIQDTLDTHDHKIIHH